MHRAFDPFSFLVVCISGWMNQDQQHFIEYPIEENRVLPERRLCTSWAGIEAAPRRQSTPFHQGQSGDTIAPLEWINTHAWLHTAKAADLQGFYCSAIDSFRHDLH